MFISLCQYISIIFKIKKVILKIKRVTIYKCFVFKEFILSNMRNEDYTMYRKDRITCTIVYENSFFAKSFFCPANLLIR